MGGIALDVVSRVERSGREDQARGGICVTVGEGEVGGGKLLGPERVPDLDTIAQGRVVAYVRTVKMPSGATAVQIVYGKRRGAHCMEHIGSAHDEQEPEALKAAARQRLAVGRRSSKLDTGEGVDGAAVVGAGRLPILASRMARIAPPGPDGRWLSGQDREPAVGGWPDPDS